MKKARLAAVAAVLAAAALGFGLRLNTRSQLAAGNRVRALGSDDHYHLRRARFAVAHFPRTLVFDRLMNFPRGGVPIWPPLYDLMLAGPTRVLHGATATGEQLEREAAWVPPVLAAGTIVLAGGFGALLFGSAGAAIAALFLAVCPAHILWTQYGHTDQHVAESFFGTLALLLYLRSRDPSSDRRQAIAREAVAGIALAAAVLAWQGAIYWGAVFALALLLEALRARTDVLRPALLILALPAAITAAATALWTAGFDPPMTYVSFGFFQPLFLASLAAGTVLLETCILAIRGALPARQARARLVFLAAAAAVILPFSGQLAGGLFRGVGYVLGKTSEVSAGAGYVSYPRDWLKGIFEARPLFADGPGLAWKELSAGFFLAPAAAAAWLLRALRGDRPGVHFGLAVWAAVTLLLAISQRLNVYYAALLAAAALVEIARLVTSRLREGPRARLAPGAAAAAVLLLALPMAPGLAQELSAVRVPGRDLFSTLEWMRRSLPHEIDAYDPGLLDSRTPPALSRARAVLGPWSLGHLILYDAELPVVANNFGYGFIDSIRFFLAGSEEEAVAIARSRNARWVVATDLVPRMNDYASYLGRPPLLAVTNGAVSPRPAYFRTMQSRLYDFDGAGAPLPDGAVPPLASFRLVYHSESAIRRGGRWLARWKVFEVLDGRDSSVSQGSRYLLR
ncbi:MAG TPA: STT3 domain-containing protein [Thermoanaerobaculia bacterium]|nr:STT3 domain-containing protein [Thermoanaerobaculia bacterium]